VRRILTIAALLSTSLACGRGSQDQAQEIDALKRRVTSLERRIASVEGNAPKSTKTEGEGATEPAAAPPTKNNVDLNGDAARVVLVHDKKRVPLPGSVPPGEYELWAMYAAGEAPEQSGTVTVTADQPLVVTCAAAARTCSAAPGPVAPPAPAPLAPPAPEPPPRTP
jgi:hypothetical protein